MTGRPRGHGGLSSRGRLARIRRPSESYFQRYFSDTSLNEDWATASLDAFNALESQALTLPYLTPALDSLSWIQRNRRIFYLGSWIGAFVDGQTSDSALTIVRDFLRDRSDLPLDLRRKVLQATDELERTVRIRRAYEVATPTSTDFAERPDSAALARRGDATIGGARGRSGTLRRPK